jgi:hypothetical protein
LNINAATPSDMVAIERERDAMPSALRRPVTELWK